MAILEVLGKKRGVASFVRFPEKQFKFQENFWLAVVPLYATPNHAKTTKLVVVHKSFSFELRFQFRSTNIVALENQLLQQLAKIAPSRDPVFWKNTEYTPNKDFSQRDLTVEQSN